MNESLFLETTGLRVSRETFDRLSAFVSLFEKWSRAINLAAPSTIGDIWQRHVADSAQLFVLKGEPIRWIDLGSGGGFPGLITAILLRELDGGWVHLVESNKKKASFLRAAVLETGARASVHPVRIENAQMELSGCDAISARALADLKLLLTYSVPWMDANPSCHAYFHKGRDYEREIEEARSEWNFDLVKHSGQVEKESVILEISNLKKCPRSISEGGHERISKPDYHGSQSKRGRR